MNKMLHLHGRLFLLMLVICSCVSPICCVDLTTFQFDYQYTLVVNTSSTLPYNTLELAMDRVDQEATVFLTKCLQQVLREAPPERYYQVTNQTSWVQSDDSTCDKEVQERVDAQPWVTCAVVQAQLNIQVPAGTRRDLLQNLIRQRLQTEFGSQLFNPLYLNQMVYRYQSPLSVRARWLLSLQGSSSRPRLNAVQQKLLEDDLLHNFAPKYLEPRGLVLDQVRVVVQSTSLIGPAAAENSNVFFHPKRRQLQLTGVALGQGNLPSPPTTTTITTTTTANTNTNTNTNAAINTNAATSTVANNVELMVTGECFGECTSPETFVETLNEQSTLYTSPIDPENPDSPSEMVQNLQEAAARAETEIREELVDYFETWLERIRSLNFTDMDTRDMLILNLTQLLEFRNQFPPEPNPQEGSLVIDPPSWIWILLAVCVGSIALAIVWTLVSVSRRNRQLLLRRHLVPATQKKPRSWRPSGKRHVHVSSAKEPTLIYLSSKELRDES